MNRQLPLFKTCSRCGETKPNTTAYFPTASAKEAKCKSCVYAYQKDWEHRNPEKVKATQKRSRDKHIEQRRAKCRKWHHAHREYCAKKQREFHRKNPGKAREYYAKNPERYRQKQRNYRHDNPEYSKEKDANMARYVETENGMPKATTIGLM